MANQKIIYLSTEWLRQGKTIAETSELMRSTIMLSKLGNMDSATATERLTSTLNGFKLEAKDAVMVVDKLISEDNAFATSTDEISTALQYSAAVAKQAGVSFDELTAYITTISSITRMSAETIGQSLKTLFTRMEQIKVGKLFEDDPTTINNVAIALNSVGIALMKNKDEFRPMGDVLDDLAKRWNTLSDKQQNAIAGTIAGVRQVPQFLTLMQNYDQVLKAQAISLDSAGLATSRYKIYLEGLEATQNRFTAEWEKFWSGQINSESIKTVINLGTSLLELAQNIDLVTLALVALADVAFINLAMNLPKLAIYLKEVQAGFQLVAEAATAAKVGITSGGFMEGIAALIGGGTAAAALAPVAATIVAITAALIALYAATQIGQAEMKAWFPTATQTAEAFDKVTTSTKDSKKELNDLAKEYEGLAGKTTKSSDDIKRLAEISETLSIKYGMTTSSLNIYNDAIDNNTEAIKNNVIAVQKQQDVIDAKYLKDNKENYDKATSFLNSTSGKNANYNSGMQAGLSPEKQLAFYRDQISAGKDITGYLKKQADELEKQIFLYKGVKDAYEAYYKSVVQAESSSDVGVNNVKTQGTSDKTKKEQEGNQLIYKLTMEGLKDLSKTTNEYLTEIDALIPSLSTLNNEMTALSNSQKENGKISVDQYEQLKKAFPKEYIDMVTFQGENIILNTDALKKQMEAQADAIIYDAREALALAGTNEELKKQAQIRLNVALALKASLLEDPAKAAKDAKAAADEQKKAYEDLLKTTIDMIKQRTEAEKQGLQDDLSAYKDSIDAKKQLIQDAADAQKQALQDQLDGYKAIIDGEKAALDAKKATNDYNDTVAGKNKEISSIDAQLLAIQFDTSQEANAKRLKLEADRVAKTKELSKVQTDYTLTNEKSALDKEYSNFELKNKAEQRAIDANLKYQTKALDAQYKAYETNIKAQIKALDAYLKNTGQITADAINMMKDQSENFYRDLIAWNRQYGDSIDDTITKAWKAAFGALQKYIGLHNSMGNWSNPANASSNNNPGGGYVDPGTGSKYHDGGVVGSASGDSEVFAKLLKKEVVATQPQVSNFLKNTIPAIAAMGGNNISINMPLTVNGNLETGILPKIKELVLSTVNTAMKDRGTNRNAFSYSL